MALVETIPIDPDRARRDTQFDVRVTDLYAWPNQPFTASFRYNETSERWIWSFEHERYGRLWPKGVATLHYHYDASPYIHAQFIDTTGDASHVTRDNLGESVELAVYPGVITGEFPPDSDLTVDEVWG